MRCWQHLQQLASRTYLAYLSCDDHAHEPREREREFFWKYLYDPIGRMRCKISTGVLSGNDVVLGACLLTGLRVTEVLRQYVEEFFLVGVMTVKKLCEQRWWTLSFVGWLSRASTTTKTRLNSTEFGHTESASQACNYDVLVIFISISRELSTPSISCNVNDWPRHATRASAKLCNCIHHRTCSNNNLLVDDNLSRTRSSFPSPL